MNKTLPIVLALAIATALPLPAAAQYIYLDSNGNGVHDAGDRLKANGTATTVDVWLVTDKNRDGSPAAPDESGNDFGFFSYVINLLAVHGTVIYGGFVNQQETMTINFLEYNPDGVRYKNGYGGQTTFGPGKYRLCSIDITGVTGAPEIDIVDMVEGSLDYTSFGTPCWGNAWDDTYKLDGPYTREWQEMGDFFDADGIAAAQATVPTPTPGAPVPPAEIPADGKDAANKCGQSAPGSLALGIAALLFLALPARR